MDQLDWLGKVQLIVRENGKGIKKVGKWGLNCFNQIFEVRGFVC